MPAVTINLTDDEIKALATEKLIADNVNFKAGDELQIKRANTVSKVIFG